MIPSLAPEHWVAIIVGALGAIGVLGAALIAALGGWWKARGDARVAVANAAAQQLVTKAQIDQQIDQRLAADNRELATKVDLLEKKVEQLERRETLKMGAVARIFRAIARQWPGAEGGPDLDPGDIELIEDTIPPHWIRRGPSLITPKENPS